MFYFYITIFHSICLFASKVILKYGLYKPYIVCILEWYNGAFSVNYGPSKLVNEEETIHTYKKEIDSGGFERENLLDVERK